ncbi:hypothetical protein CVT24_010519 [Panaeolus cyanescens]|uniref:GH18 domain-containing protein n=1 Tax=Panaeolus cyanescens TaxID=181874 RepID=A0A409YYF7_9AGAR|nr:hypothetical protein CVT24_010519 [Panaeolus cyanescens]
MRTFGLLLSTLSLLALAPINSFALGVPQSALIEKRQVTTSNAPSFVAAAWYPSWLSSQVPPEIDGFRHVLTLMFILYSNSLTSVDPGQVIITDADRELLPRFVAEAKKNGVKAMLSIGGWTGSRYFSRAVMPRQRDRFIEGLLKVVDEFGLDGLDFDWEYPNAKGIGCNENKRADADNFLAFLQALRAHPKGQSLILSAAAHLNPWLGRDGNSLSDVSKFAEALDFVAIMGYDIYGRWSGGTVGPNAPLVNTCSVEPSSTPTVSGAVQSWNFAGLPLNKTVLGVPTYGYGYNVSPLEAGKMAAGGDVPSFMRFRGEWMSLLSWVSYLVPDVCGVTPKTYDGTFTFKALTTEGFLDNEGNAMPGVTYKFDECSKTPFLYDPAREIMVSYDNAQSMAEKGAYINAQQLRGFSAWAGIGDHNDILIGSLNMALGRV